MNNFKFNISLSILNHLGRNLYRNFITVLGEAISNSWDADAKNVWLYIDRNKNTLIIKDDGDGMSAEDFQNKFLKIGYSKRQNNNSTTPSGRPFIGRKGIGKLALLSCAERIHILTRTSKEEEFIGGVIDNAGLDDAIDQDLTPQEYKLGEVDVSLFESVKQDLSKGTIIYFEDLTEGIFNKVEYIKTLVALDFRFSLIDPNFNIYINDEPINIDQLNGLAESTQFVWQINDIEDPYLQEKISSNQKNILKYKTLNTKETNIRGFVATVSKPSNLNIRGLKNEANKSVEKVSVDLFVNGRLREKNILRHIPASRIVENYLYGQIHFDLLDDSEDRFTSSREGVKSDDPLFANLLDTLKGLLKKVFSDWDLFRVGSRQDGDPDNERLTKPERKARELFNIVSDDYLPPKDSPGNSLVNGWIDEISQDCQFNIPSYTECFIAENLLRKHIQYNEIPIPDNIIKKADEWIEKTTKPLEKANISYDIRRNPENKLLYLDLNPLAYVIEYSRKNESKPNNLIQDSYIYKPLRDAVAHTSLLTDPAKEHLNITFENIKAKMVDILSNLEQ